MKRTTAEPTVADQTPTHPWHSWGSPIGLSIGLLAVGGFFALFAIGLQTLAGTGY